jgi:hypothetical protein
LLPPGVHDFLRKWVMNQFFIFLDSESFIPAVAYLFRIPHPFLTPSLRI